MPKEYSNIWLTLGESLERLIDIWPSLLTYMQDMVGKQRIKPKKKRQ